jgi:hypothetical protein
VSITVSVAHSATREQPGSRGRGVTNDGAGLVETGLVNIPYHMILGF